MTQQLIYFVSILFVAGFGIAFRWGYVYAMHVCEQRCKADDIVTSLTKISRIDIIGQNGNSGDHY